MNRRNLSFCYRRGVEFIAYNDNDGEIDADVVGHVAEYLSVAALAAAFRVPERTVARDVVRIRQGGPSPRRVPPAGR